MASRAPEKTLHVEVVTAERELYNGEATQVQAPGADGQLGILPGHAALLTFLTPGMLRIELGDAEAPLFVSGGFLEVANNRVTILADAAEHAEEIDRARAEEARQRAQQRLAEASNAEERAEYQAALERAVSRLHVLEFARRRTRRRLDVQGVHD
ncbi:F-type H+-transporting ATPase subunit epsilon [Thermosporothrix hazakensis]|jgi:F-type H+-transporting ATPase subunit epsilon|uniref:ATP synthase epsilon chain n=2 Tax=Thermosporothrix TaxID=768650 RepID=A0A326U2C0_THEHA|nr:F0F1 ATP synthase subunit epsilon [Thermosporothrix hazakensis]PZW22573.1 F-type H+-transporting ATPase subunit epsilon [Thermosporothrix hazakensis]BBH90493.1 ATP synthase epsilon chain [Thermosporothrix sp. COM3]GCE48545.1 ATP synthase epsilon chain [Thermosporothrix hazakensis]